MFLLESYKKRLEMFRSLTHVETVVLMERQFGAKDIVG